MSIWNVAAARWLLFDGLLPLLGAGVLFLLWGGIRYVTATDKSVFNYSWKQARDPMGWLYGAAILAMQAASQSAVSGNSLLTVSCFAAGAVCLLLLLSAMTNRGEDPTWKPPRSLEVVVGILILAILTAGYNAHSV
jgi:hypothetical protein